MKVLNKFSRLKKIMQELSVAGLTIKKGVLGYTDH